jgi:Caspase domain
VNGSRSALIIASDEYADPGLRRLRAPANDARALTAVLQDPAIGDFEVRTLLNEPAHAVNLAVEDFFADRRPEDLLLVHFSGHGVKDEEGELYFAASNTVLGRLGATAVAAQFISRRMNRSRSKRVVLLLDCCYAGAFERGLVARAGVDMGIEQQFNGRGRAVITASSAMQYAFEAGELADTRELSPSVFTSALVEGLETGEADRNQDGMVGLDELYDYVYDKVRAATPNQTPGKWTFGVEGELYIARRSRPVTTPAPLPPELRQAIESPLARVRAGAVEELARMLRGQHAGMALAARLALEQLTDDDSRKVAATATAALATPVPTPPRPLRPELKLSATVIDLGRVYQYGQSPEHRVRIGNAGGGELNARASTTANWLRLRQANDELIVTTDTKIAGEYQGTVTVDSNGGTATIRVHARVDPTPLPPREVAHREEAHTAPPSQRREHPQIPESSPQRDPVLAARSGATAPPLPVRPATGVAELLKRLAAAMDIKEFESILSGILDAKSLPDAADRIKARREVSKDYWYDKIHEQFGDILYPEPLWRIFQIIVIPDLENPDTAKKITEWTGYAHPAVISGLLAAARQSGDETWQLMTKIMQPRLAQRWAIDHGIETLWDANQAAQAGSGTGRSRFAFFRRV